MAKYIIDVDDEVIKFFREKIDDSQPIEIVLPQMLRIERSEGGGVTKRGTVRVPLLSAQATLTTRCAPLHKRGPHANKIRVGQRSKRA